MEEKGTNRTTPSPPTPTRLAGAAAAPALPFLPTGPGRAGSGGTVPGGASLRAESPGPPVLTTAAAAQGSATWRGGPAAAPHQRHFRPPRPCHRRFRHAASGKWRRPAAASGTARMALPVRAETGGAGPGGAGIAHRTGTGCACATGWPGDSTTERGRVFK